MGSGERTDAEAKLSASVKDRNQAEQDLRVAARLEGRPFPTAKRVARSMGISAAAAFRLLARLRRTGVLRMISLPHLRDDVCECVAYLETSLMDGATSAALEQRIRQDPSVVSAVRLSGRHEIRLEAIHADVQIAQTWFRELIDQPGVLRGRLLFLRTVFRRWAFAAAILGSAYRQEFDSDVGD